MRATGPRLNLMRAIAAGEVEFDPDRSAYMHWPAGGIQSTVTSRFNELRTAGLVRQVRFTDAELTEAGRLWLAEREKEN